MKDGVRLAMVCGVFLGCLLGWAAAGYVGAGIGMALGLATCVLPWWRQPLWSWAAVYLRRNRPIELIEPLAVANDRAGGGVRIHDDVAVTALQVLGKPYRPTWLTGSTATHTANTLDISELTPHMHQSLDLEIESITVVSSGSRRRSVGDYPRVYDTLIGTSPYAGRRETWMIIRIATLDNGEALQWRDTVGTAALAAAQRISAALRCRGIRVRVASASDMAELEKRLGSNSLEPRNRRWRSLRGDAGWNTTYAYRPVDINAETLAQAWSLPADGITQNLTIFPDGSATATVTVHTAQPATTSPSVILQTLPGEQAPAVAAGLCCPRPEIRGLRRGRLPRSLEIPVGPSGVLLGKTASGDRLLMPLGDPGQHGRVSVIADDLIAKRIVIRTAGAGERITVHTHDLQRWSSVRMPNVVVTDNPRPLPGTTVSVTDGTVQPAPRPTTVIAVSPPNAAHDSAADVVITQSDPTTVRVDAAGMNYEAEVEFFRAENRYASESAGIPGDFMVVD
ncbi:MAG: type VII secretion protein EccE [Mycobacterium sp.]